MLPRSMSLLPVLRACGGIARMPVQSQTRNVWDLVRATDPRSVIRDMNREMERMERNFFRNLPFSFALPRIVPINGDPTSNKNFRVNIDVEGYKPEEIKISMKKNVMRIEAKTDRAGENGSRLQRSFVQEFTIPENIDQSSLKSFLHHDGLLCIEADLVKADSRKDIPIQVEGEIPNAEK